MPSARPAGLSTDPQAGRRLEGGGAGGAWRGLWVHTHCLIPQARGQLQERGGAGTRETLTRVGAMTCESEGLSLLQGASGNKLVPLPLDEKSGGLPSYYRDGGCSGRNLGRTLRPWRAGVKENRGGPWRLGDRASEAVAKGESSLGNLLLLLPLCLPWPRVPGESSIAEPLIGAARPGEPKL